MSSDKGIGRGASTVAACAAVLAASVAGCPDEAQAIDQIERYCTVSWRNAHIEPQEWHECTQETFSRLLQRVPRESLPNLIGQTKSDERRELNRCIWSVVQKHRRTRRSLSLDDSPPIEDRSESREPDAGLDALLDRVARKLTPAQCTVLRRWSQGDTIAQIASDLETTPARVSDHKHKALVRIRTELQTAGRFDVSDFLA